MSTGDKEKLILQRLQALCKAQETRVSIYHEFESAYNDYLTDKCPAEQYYSICGIVTEGFQEVSLEIQAIERDLADNLQQTHLAGLIRRLQEEERTKLKQTAQLQIYTIESRTSDKDYVESIQDRQTELKQVRDRIAAVWEEIRQEMTDLSYALAA